MNAASLHLLGVIGDAVSRAEEARDVTPWILLLLLTVVLITGALIVLLLVRHVRLRKASGFISEREPPRHGRNARCLTAATGLESPGHWLAIRTRNLVAVQTALGLNNPVPCSWMEGMAQLGDCKLFISPPVNGWTLVIGSHLPEPGEDVDACFRFLQRLSRELGEVQYFHSNRVVGHHAWARFENGRVVRGYAWAGETLWNQGARTWAERKLGLHCYEYCSADLHSSLALFDQARLNAEKVALLAATWSVDPTTINGSLLSRAHGVAGDFSPARLH